MKPTSTGPETSPSKSRAATPKSPPSGPGSDENPTVELSALFEQEPDFEHLPDVHPPAPAAPKPPRAAKAAKAPRPAKATKAARTGQRPPRKATPRSRPPAAAPPESTVEADPTPAAGPEIAPVSAPVSEPDPQTTDLSDDATEVLETVPETAPEPEAVAEAEPEVEPEPVAEPEAEPEPESAPVEDEAAATAELEVIPDVATAVLALDDDLDKTTELRAIPAVEQTAVLSVDDLTADGTAVDDVPPADDSAEPDEAEAEPARPAKRRRSRVKLALLAVVAVLFLVVGWSVGMALAKPTTESTSAKLAEWGRDHNLGPVVTWLEKEQYKLNPPRTGGKLAGGIQVGNGTKPKPTKAPASHAVEPAHTTAPANLTPIVHDGAYPNEGVWQPLVSTPSGLPMVLGTAIRPDTTHTSYQVGIAWMDPKLVRFELHPGSEEPPGTWSTADTLGTPALEKGLVAAFNAGFRLPDGSSRGGWYLDGKWAYPAHSGAESFVIYKDGHVDIGRWGTQVTMTPQVAAVRQNLDALLVPGAGGTVAINPSVDENNTATWGYTLGAKLYVPRSGVGITRTGAIVYAAGLTNTRTLATVLRDAGCVRAMELDINYEWTIFTAFERAAGTTAQSSGPITGTKLTPDEQQPADHFLSTSARDFFAVYAK